MSDLPLTPKRVWRVWQGTRKTIVPRHDAYSIWASILLWCWPKSLRTPINATGALFWSSHWLWWCTHLHRHLSQKNTPTFIKLWSCRVSGMYS